MPSTKTQVHSEEYFENYKVQSISPPCIPQMVSYPFLPHTLGKAHWGIMQTEEYFVTLSLLSFSWVPLFSSTLLAVMSEIDKWTQCHGHLCGCPHSHVVSLVIRMWGMDATFLLNVDEFHHPLTRALWVLHLFLIIICLRSSLHNLCTIMGSTVYFAKDRG